MVNESRYFIVGGIFTDGTFSKIEDNGSVMLGPYKTAEEAETVRDGMNRKNLDICWYKLWVVTTEFWKNV